MQRFHGVLDECEDFLIRFRREVDAICELEDDDVLVQEVESTGEWCDALELRRLDLFWLNEVSVGMVDISRMLILRTSVTMTLCARVVSLWRLLLLPLLLLMLLLDLAALELIVVDGEEDGGGGCAPVLEEL